MKTIDVARHLEKFDPKGASARTWEADLRSIGVSADQEWELRELLIGDLNYDESDELDFDVPDIPQKPLDKLASFEEKSFPKVRALEEEAVRIIS